jgi:acyl-[acyl-carrier-protein]-phospholipid O-acyltransferase / long-chain-fatty-acid--[acyl-carrier-protein] ligase
MIVKFTVGKPNSWKPLRYTVQGQRPVGARGVTGTMTVPGYASILFTSEGKILVRSLLCRLLGALFRVRVEGDAAPLRSQRVLIVANHDSLLDGVILGLFLPADVTVAVTRKEAEHPLVRLLLRAVPHVVLDAAHPLALKRLMRLVERGKPVVVFPQGAPTATGGMTKVYESAAVTAARCRAQVVPVRITGTLYSRFALVRGNFPKRCFPSVTVRILAAQQLSAPPLSGRMRRRALGDAMLRIMQHMMFASQPRRTLFEALLDAAAMHGYSTRILEDVQGEHSYRDIMKASLVLGRMASRYSEEGERVGVLMPNVAPTVSLVLGLGLMRRVPAMLNYTAGPDALRSACIAAGVKTVITSRRFVGAAQLAPALAALSTVRIVYLEDLRGRFGFADKFWLLGWALPRPRSVIRVTDPEEIAVVLFTSGSEARPKGVALSHRALLANMAQMGAVIDFGPDDKFLAALPLYHSYGLTACTLMPLIAGTRVLLYTTPLHYHVIPELAYTRACTYVFGTSTFLGHYARRAHPYDFHSTRVVVSGAEKLSTEVADLWLRKFGLRIMEGYGATECAPVLSLNTPLAYKARTVGRFLPGVEHRVMPIPGILRGGVLHVRGPNLMSGYYLYDRPGVPQPPESEAGPGWYNTGDVVEVDAEGFVTIHGRAKRFAKIAGEMVSLEVVESLARHASPRHHHAATVELIQQSGESTVLFTTDPELDRVKLQRAARDLGGQELAVARRIVHVRELPLLGSGKTDYVMLRQAAEERAADPGTQWLKR